MRKSAIGANILNKLLTLGLCCAIVFCTGLARAEEEVKIGVLHSLTGTMAISETSLRDVVLMAVDEINSKGGVLGKKIVPVVVDPASNWDLFA
jgi:urea transport system substrate-binding protein